MPRTKVLWTCASTVMAAATMAAAQPLQPPAGQADVMAQLGRQVRQLSEQAGPSIVRIEVDTPVPQNAPPGVIVLTRRRVGVGFVVAEGGFVMTTAETVQLRAHWVASAPPGPSGGLRLAVSMADSAQVIDAKGRRSTARVVGTCNRSNVALLQVDGLDAPPLTLGDERKLAVGDLTVALSPAGLPIAVGVVNGLHARSGVHRVEDLVSLSLPAGRAASGSPVVASDGKVVGMVSAADPGWLNRGYREDLSAGPAGVGVLAIPASFLSRALPDLKTAGCVLYGYLGVRIGQRQGGVYVGEVVDDSPARRVGLLREDRLLALDGKQIADAGDFERQIAQRRPGERVTLDVGRGRDALQVKVVLGQRPQDEGPAVALEPFGGPPESLRQFLLRVPDDQQAEVGRRLRAHILELRRVLEEQLRQLAEQLNVLNEVPATRPADPDDENGE